MDVGKQREMIRLRLAPFTLATFLERHDIATMGFGGGVMTAAAFGCGFVPPAGADVPSSRCRRVTQ